MGSYQQHESGQTRTKTDSHVGDDSRVCLGQGVMFTTVDAVDVALWRGVPAKGCGTEMPSFEKDLGKHNCTRCGSPSVFALARLH